MTRRRPTPVLITAAVVLVVVSGLVGPSAATASPTSATKIGGWSQYGNWTQWDAAVGPVDVYRGYDTGFRYPTWQEVPAGHRKTGNPDSINDYSFRLPPEQLLAGDRDAELRTFIASTPRNVVLTNYHEPEQEVEQGLFTHEQFRRAIVRLGELVDEQNAVDGGTRRVSVILMISTFAGYKGRSADAFWPTTGKGDGGTADLISADVYAPPHGTGTLVPTGYTTGEKWKSAAGLLRPVLRFARLQGTDWAVSELGVLEDVNDSERRSKLLREVVDVARAGRIGTLQWRPALWVSYWNSRGGRADWGLRFGHPVPTESTDSLAFRTWHELANLP